MTNLSKSAQSVQDVLTQHGLACVVVELSDSTRTAAEAAQTIGCEVGQIVKSLIFKTESHLPVLVLASGPNRVNEKTVELLLGEKIAKADADFVRAVTGFAIGGVPPIGHKEPIARIFIDQDLLQYETIWAAAGTPRAVFQIRGADLVNISGARPISW